MNWNEIGTQIILGILGIVLSALGTYVTYLVNKHFKDGKGKDIFNSLITLVRNSVLEVYQTYVEALKKEGKFDLESQKKALEKGLALVKANMSKEIENWLKENYDDVDVYLKSLIESQIGFLKNNAK